MNETRSNPIGFRVKPVTLDQLAAVQERLNAAADQTGEPHRNRSETLAYCVGAAYRALGLGENGKRKKA